MLSLALSSLACVGCVSVGFSARSRHFFAFCPRKNWGERKQWKEGGGGGRAQFSCDQKSEKCFKHAENLLKCLLRRLGVYNQVKLLEIYCPKQPLNNMIIMSELSP